jgi:outer membrane protein OmpA-like peptidoglycan-associated protein
MNVSARLSACLNLCIKLLPVYVTLVISALTVNGQSDRRLDKLFNDARQQFSMQSYSNAIDISNKIIAKDPSYLDAFLLLADIYNEINDPEQEIVILKKAINLKEIPLISLRLGNALLSTGRYEEALFYYTAYMDKERVSEELRQEVEMRMESCRFAMDALMNSVEFDPQRLSDSVNSSFDEYWPSLSIDNSRLVFTRLIRAPGMLPQEDFYVSERTDYGWSLARPIEEINTPDNEGAQCLSADGSILFFTACNRPDGMGSCDIYYSVLTDDGWTDPVSAGPPLNSSSWDAHPSLSSDNRYLYFSSNRPGGKGGRDIWRAELLGVGPQGRLKWKEPVNLGDSVNTPGNETSPFIHAGNKNLYFASDYHIGMGRFDIFMSEITDDSVFTKPVNLGYPVNTFNDEQGMFISADGLTAFFSSPRENPPDIDIYSFSLEESLRPHPATYARVNVYDEKTMLPLRASVELTNLTAGEFVRRTEVTDKRGKTLLCLPAGNNYAFSVEKEGYLFYSEHFDLSETKQSYDPYELDIMLKSIDIGAEMDLYNIYFETDSFTILPESEPELTRLAGFLETNPSLEVEIQGHTDNTGDSEHNLKLSENRAGSVAGYLISYGIDSKRLSMAGFGEDKPVADNDTEEGRRLNRRTTIKIVGK